MKIDLSPALTEQLKAFLAAFEDAEALNDNEYVVDLYDVSDPMSLDIVFTPKGEVRLDGAEVLSYSEEMDGYYLSAPIKDVDRVVKALQEAGAFAE